MEFKQIQEWKEEELKRDLEAFDNFLKEYRIQQEKDSERVDKFNSRFSIAMGQLGIKDRSNTTPEQEEEIRKIVKQISDESDKGYREFSKFKKDNSYMYNLYYKSMYAYHKSKGEEDVAMKEITEMLKKDIDKHFDKLQAKVENKIGKIELIYHIGGDDYRFEGENGSCSVRVILAGVYKIQRLHTRWVVMN